MADEYFIFQRPRKRAREIVKRATPVPPNFVGPGVAGRAAQYSRLAPKLASLEDALTEKHLRFGDASEVDLAEEILVLEIAGSFEEFCAVVRDVEGMEHLFDEETEFQPAHGFQNRDKRKENEPITGLLYLIATNQTALRQLREAWELKKDGETLSGVASKLGKILDRVVDIRPWGVEDRLREEDRNHWLDEIAGGPEIIRFEAELWYRDSKVIRDQQAVRLSRMVSDLGGRIVSRYEHTGTEYHGITVELPVAQARELLLSPQSAELFQLESVYHYWCVGQSVGGINPEEGEPSGTSLPAGLPDASPLVALLDGLPIANHPLLAGRLEVDDPDDRETDYPVKRRGHGTQMASAICHGDLSAGQEPLPCSLYCRPILVPAPNGTDEWIPDDERPGDLLERCIHRMKLGEGGEPPEAPTVQVVNLSVGDIRRVFEGHRHSAWARMIDWLQYRYNVLIVVSAGNTDSLITGLTATQFDDLPESECEKAIFDARFRASRQLRIISPAETLNGLTIGASHTDAGGQFSPAVNHRLAVFHPDLPAPYSRIGPGFRGAVKPELLMPGGRALLRGRNDDAVILDRGRAPGIKVASPPLSPGDTAREAYTRGTSPAAALATREAAFIILRLQAMGIRTPPVEFQPVLAKALLVHSASWHAADSRLREHFGNPRRDESHIWKPKKIMPQVGYGRGRTIQGMSNATVLGWGQIAADEILQFAFPIPECLHNRPGKRRFTVTLAWFSPINPSNRRYRVAKLSLNFPEKPNDIVASNAHEDVGARVGGRGTVQHKIFEGRALRGIVDDDFFVEVECLAEGGPMAEPVNFGLAVTLEGEEAVFPELREQIQQRLQIQSRVQV